MVRPTNATGKKSTVISINKPWIITDIAREKKTLSMTHEDKKVYLDGKQRGEKMLNMPIIFINKNRKKSERIKKRTHS